VDVDGLPAKVVNSELVSQQFQERIDDYDRYCCKDMDDRS